jgi:hypothetical protein
VLLASLGPLRFVRCTALLHRAVHSLSVHYCTAATLLFASFIMLYSVLWSYRCW